MSVKNVIVNNLTFYGDMSPADLERQADYILTALREAGFAVVPVEPTEAMHDAFAYLSYNDEGDSFLVYCKEVWDAMLKAAQGGKDAI